LISSDHSNLTYCYILIVRSASFTEIPGVFQYPSYYY
jgi:hypothetical protein